MKHTFHKVGLKPHKSMIFNMLQIITAIGPESKKQGFHTWIRMTCACGCAAMAIMLMAIPGGCGGTPGTSPSDPQNQAVDPAMKAEGQSVFRPFGKRGSTSGEGTPLNPSAGPNLANSPGIDRWTIVVAVVPPSPDAAEQDALAQQLLEKIQTVGQLPDAALQRRSKGLVIISGSTYAAMTDKANQEVERIRGIIVGGTFPYSRAYLAPPELSDSATQTVGTGSMSPLDLRSVAIGKPAKVKLFSLEVGVYGHEDRRQPTAEEAKRFRGAAEEAARALRAEGHEAYFFHGQNSSSVTVGVFTEADFDKNAREGLAIAKARQLFPSVLFNGATMKDKNRNGALVPCQVVNVPR